MQRWAFILVAVAGCSEPAAGAGSTGPSSSGSAGTDPSSTTSADSSTVPGSTSSSSTSSGSNDTANSSGEATIQPDRLRDQSGAEFDWVCAENGHCSIERIEGVSPPFPDCGERDPRFGYAWARFFEIAAGCDSSGSGWVFVPGGGRLVVCDGLEDCPQLTESYGDAFECREGYCQNVDIATYPLGPPREFELELLCTGAAPRYDDIEPAPDLQAAIDAACPGGYADPCVSIPDGCPDPG